LSHFLLALDVLLDSSFDWFFGFTDIFQLLLHEGVLKLRGFRLDVEILLYLFVEPILVDKLELVLELVSPVVIVS